MTTSVEVTVKLNVKVVITQAQFARYLKVQQGGRYNMFSPQARAACGLSREEFFAIAEKYEELEQQFGESTS